jgi:hypothetical protein
VKNSPKIKCNTFFVKINPLLLPWKKVAQNLGNSFSKQQLSVNCCQIDKISPNLVTLVMATVIHMYLCIADKVVWPLWECGKTDFVSLHGALKDCTITKVMVSGDVAQWSPLQNRR